MKRFILGLFTLGFTVVGFAQSNSNVTSVGLRPSPEVLEKAMRNATQFDNKHVNLKQQVQPGYNAGSRGSRALSFDTLGTAENAFTVLDGAVNRVASEQATNSVVFIHRANSVVDPGTNVAQYKYDISKNGGNSWTIDLGPLTPTLENFDTAGRFPQIALYNPTGNTNPDESYVVYYGTWLPYGGTGSGRTWDGVVTGVAKTDDDPASYTENIQRPNNGDINIAKSLCNGLPGEFWSINYSTLPTDSTAINDLLVSKGVWNNTTNDVDWTHTRLNIPMVIQTNGGSPLASASIAFDPTGMMGWIGFLGDVTLDDDSTLNPVFYRTVDGGANWTGPIAVNLKNFENVKNGLTIDTIPTSGFDADLVVDANGNPHYAFVVGTNAGTGYSIATGAQGGSAGLKIYDITYNPNVSAECQWQAIYIDDIETLRGTLSSGGGADFSEDNRPQVSRSEDGNIIFIGWSDSDGSLTGGENTLPNFKGRMLNIQTGLGTPVVNFTEADAVWSGSALLPSVSPTFITSGSTYTVPTVFLEFNTVSGNSTDPAQFYYIKDIKFTSADFTQALGADVPTITLLGDNPQYVYLGESYTEAGATADDCNDGDLTSAIVVDASAVNTNSRNTYTVVYNVTDSDNNTATEERQVIVNTEPDAKFGFTLGAVANQPLAVQFRDSSLYNPTAWQWNFGDGTGSANRNPIKTYTAAGTYNVCLTARNIYNNAPFNKPADQECQTIVVTSIEEKAIANSFNIYPNPSKGIFNIELKSPEYKNASIEVYNVLGEKITAATVNVNAKSNFRLDMSNHANGVYMVKFITEKGTASKSISLVQ